MRKRLRPPIGTEVQLLWRGHVCKGKVAHYDGQSNNQVCITWRTYGDKEGDCPPDWMSPNNLVFKQMRA